MPKVDRKKPDKLKVCIEPIAIKSDNGSRVIKGYASTPTVDSYNEIVKPTAFAKYLPDFKEYPVMLVNHSWFDIPIGQFDVVEIRDDGLYVEATVSKTAMGDDVWTLIQDGVLKAFSIGYWVHKSEYDDDSKITTLTEIELVEISVVNVPANRQALFEAAKSRGLKSFAINQTSEPPNKKGADMPELDIKQEVKKAVDDEVTNATAKVTEAVKVTLEPKIEDIEEKFLSMMTEAKEAAKNCVTTAEHKELVEKLKAIEDAQQIIHNRQQKILAGQTKEVVVPENGIEDMAIDHPYGKAYGAALTLPECMLDQSKDAINEWRQAHDDLCLLNHLMGAKFGRMYKGPQTLKSFGRYKDLTDQIFGKAMSATGTGYGDEWVPTEMSAQLTELVEAKAVIASQFPVVPMPTNPWDIPYKGGHVTIYIYDEPTVDFATEISRSTPTTGKNTLTAKGFAAATVVSKDATEDSLIAILPMVRDDLAQTMAREWDNAYINGDTSATHRDTQHSMNETTDIRKAFDGLRHQANADSKEYDCQTVLGPNSADWEAADIVMVRKLMGASGAPEMVNDMFLALSLDNFYEAWLWDEVKTVDKFGPMAATIVKGSLPYIFGIPILTSSYIRTDYNSTGLYDASGKTTSLCLMVNKKAWVSGSRRAITIETDPNILTQQTVVVATARRAFKLIRAASTEYSTVAGINIPVL